MLKKETDEIKSIIINVDGSNAKKRIDQVIAGSDIGLSRNRAQSLIADGRVSVDGKSVTSKKYITDIGEQISITMKEEAPLDVEAEDIPIDIVYEDEDLIVVNKPKGMVVHPAPGNISGTLVNAMLYHCGDSLSSINGVIRPGIVHRIDKDTSGLLVVAKNDKAHKALSEQLSNHSMMRRYEAIVLNNIKQDDGTVDAPIGRDPKNRLRNKVIEGGRSAVTHYEVIERFGNYTYISLKLETGRTHQIRVHMSYIGHPLLGDSLYSNAKNSFGAKSQVLHAGLLGFVHPATGEYMEFECPLPLEFQTILDKLRNQK